MKKIQYNMDTARASKASDQFINLELDLLAEK